MRKEKTALGNAAKIGTLGQLSLLSSFAKILQTAKQVKLQLGTNCVPSLTFSMAGNAKEVGR